MSEDVNQLPATPSQTIGPFFHYALPYERGHELVPPATPGALRLHGSVFDGAGMPVIDAMMEIRQADPAGMVPMAEGSLHRDGTVFTGWGRAATNAAGHYSFTTVEPGPPHAGSAPFFSVALFARGLTDRLFTRAYVPGPAAQSDPLLVRLDSAERDTLVAVREPDGSLRFDIHLQGSHETVFLEFPRHRV